MSQPKLYKQVKLIELNGSKQIVTHIPAESAIIGKTLKIKELRGKEWMPEIYVVSEVYESSTVNEETLNKRSNQWRDWRYEVDI